MMDDKYKGYERYRTSDIVRSKIITNIRSENNNTDLDTQFDEEREKIHKRFEDSKELKMLRILYVGLTIGILAVIICIIKLGGIGIGCILGIIVIGITIAANYIVGRQNDRNEKEALDELEERRNNEKRKANEATENKIKEQIALYDNNVKEAYDKIITNLSNIETMVDYSVDMFKRMISHADCDSSTKFIECIFEYVVTFNEVKYLYESEYTNPRDDFNFEKQRFRNLQYDYECEGLALALAQAVSNRMRALYPPNTLNISIGNVDSKVKINFKALNENFVVARDIL